jgi:hypothetical protein
LTPPPSQPRKSRAASGATSASAPNCWAAASRRAGCPG